MAEDKTCICEHWFPLREVRERCPIHRSAVRPPGHNYWNGAKCTWQENPVWPSQTPWTDERAESRPREEEKRG